VDGVGDLGVVDPAEIRGRDPEARAPQHDDDPAEPETVRLIPAARMMAMISSTVGGSADTGVLCCGGRPW
jgi:hypothetical protein